MPVYESKDTGGELDRTLIAALQRRAREGPHRLAFTFLADGELESATLTYGRLERQARALAARLLEDLEPGDRALLLYPPGLEFIPAFLGCLYAGVVAVPVSAPRSNERSPVRLSSIARDAEPRVVLTTSSLLAGSPQGWRNAVPILERALWCATEETGSDGDPPDFPEPAPDAPAFLQYTSGSTSDPKGVLVTHANLVHNQRMIGSAFAQDESSLVVGWLPLFHDMGLIGQVLQPLWAGARCVLMSPAAFLQKPVRWLTAISRYQATTSGGPNFAYELCAAKIPPHALSGLDLSSWRVAFNGAEPVRASTLERFAEKFGLCGFRRSAFHPCYGLAEATLFVSGGASGREPRVIQVDAAALERNQVAAAEDSAARALVSSGHAWLDQAISIVDPQTGRERSAGSVGEIWVSGPSIAGGYWGQPASTESDFRASLQTLEGGLEGPFLRTGDLGFLLDGELYVTGRLKDLVILRGRNHYPQDLELTAEQSHRDLRPGGGAAFSTEVEGEERLVIVHEVERHRRDTPEEIAAAVRREVARSHEIQVHDIVLIRTGSLPRTTSGKVQRRACRSAYLAGSLAVVGRSILSTVLGLPEGATAQIPDRALLTALGPLDRRDLLEAFVRERAAAVLGMAAGAVGPVQPLTDLGLDSLSALQLKGTLEGALAVPVPFDGLLSGLGVRALADLMAAGLEAGAGMAGEVEEAIERSPPCTRPEPLSPGQKGLWVVDRLAPAEAVLNIAVAGRARGLDCGAFQRALTRVAARHEALRTVFAWEGGEPVQRTLPKQAPDLRRVEAVGWIAEGLALRLEEEAWAPFDLETGPLLRVRLFDLGDADSVLLLVVHHLVADFWSLSLMVRELAALYHEECGLPAAALPSAGAAPRPVDYTRWLERRLAGPGAERLWSFWRQQLVDLPDLGVSTDRPRPPVQAWRGRAVSRRLASTLRERLQEIGAGRSATLFMTLLAVFQEQLGRYSGQEAFAVGSPTAGRDRPELAGLVSYLVNPLPLRTDLAGNPTYVELLDRVRGMVLSSLRHGALPFPWMVERSGGERSTARPPLYQAQFVLHPRLPGDDPGLAAFALGESRIELGGVPLEAVRLRQKRVQVEIGLSAAVDAAGRLALVLETRSDLFDAVTGERMLEHIVRLLEGAAAAPHRHLAELSLLSEGERAQLLVEWSGEATAGLREATIHALFAKQAALWPAAVAVVGAEEFLTYAELQRRAGCWARRLRAAGVGPEVRVGVCLDRSLARVVATLAVLEAGGAYVPLDPFYPRERLDLLIRDSGASVLVTEERWLHVLQGAASPVLCLDRDELWKKVDGRLPDIPASGLAYVMYTSGSTGQPKGVAVPHRAVVRLVRETGYAGFGPGEVFLQLSPYSFDASTLELWGALLNGGCLVIPPAGLVSPAELGDLLRRHRVTTLWLTAGLFHQMVEENLPGLAGVRQLLAGGDVLSVSHVRRVLAELPGTRLINGYGPTENTTFTCCCTVTATEGLESSVPLGRPISNTWVYVLDRHFTPVPIGVAGELCTGGDGLARGYLGGPERTAEHFIPDPFAREAGGRLYRTGDLVRWRRTGELEYLGRIDAQVKVRGFRVEPGEIEAALSAHSWVREAVVLAERESGSDRRLVAYVVGAVGEMAGAPELRSFLRERLPEFMVPADWVFLPALPLTPNAKVDRKALAMLRPKRVAAESGRAPRTPVEELVAGIFAEVLGLEEVGVEGNFFELGGHSLLAMQVASRVRSVFGVDLPLRTIFEVPTVAGLANRLERSAAVGEGLRETAIVRISREGPLELSFAQQRLWFLDQLEPGSPLYNIPAAVELTGSLEVAVLAATLCEVVRRHEALRTRFRSVSGEPVQIVLPGAAVMLPVIDLQGLPTMTRVREAERLSEAEARRPFDLGDPGGGPLLRATLLKLGAGQHTALLTMHHIASDGWSMGVLLREFGALYTAFLAGRPSPLTELTVQYADFAAWQRRRLSGELLEQELACWRDDLLGMPQALELPADHPRPATLGVQGAVRGFALDGVTLAGLGGLSRRQGTTLFMTLLAGFAVLLQRYSGQDDLAVGAPVAGRTRVETEPLIGLFVNTLVLRVDLAGDPEIAKLLGRVRETTLAAYAHQEVPFERLVDDLAAERDLSRPPLVQVLLAVQNTPTDPLQLPGLTLTASAVRTGTAKFELTCTLAETGRGLAGTLEYNRDLFEAPTIERLAGHYLRLLAGISADPRRRLSELPLLSGGEQAQLLIQWNDIAAIPPSEVTLHDLFEAQAAQTPEAVALVAGLSGERWTYRELDLWAGSLARRLADLGVGPEVRVGVCLSRTPLLVASLLAVLKAGGAYVPLDPGYPRERLAFMLEDSAATVVLTEQGSAGRLSELRAELLLADVAPSQGAWGGPGVASGVLPGNLAYLIYTSGSTGRPKAVAIEHRSAVAFAHWARTVFPPEDLEGVLAGTSISFDLSIFELFVPLAWGGKVVLAADALELPRLAAAGEVKLVNTVPSAMAELVRQNAVPESVRTINLAGEPLKRSLVEAIYSSTTAVRVLDLYGPSEATTYSTWAPAWGGDRREPAIGRPVAGTRAFVLDTGLRPVPLGVPGELFLGGAGLARGYLDRPELTSERFVPDPHGAPGERLYRTGDLVRHRPDGCLEFLGRCDHQVKVRGFRIETGEVEAALARHPAVREAVVIAAERGSAGLGLVACVVPSTAGATGAEELQDHLRKCLPAYMVPGMFHFLESMPRTVNRKLDRRALGALPLERREIMGDAGAPRSPGEELVARIWCDVLGLDAVGIHESFFRLGGDSILTLQVVARVGEAGYRLTPKQVFLHPTVAELAAALVAGSSTAEQGPLLGPVPLSPIQHWFFAGEPVEPHHWNQAVLLEVPEGLDLQALTAAAWALVEHHDALRLRFRRGQDGWEQWCAAPDPTALEVARYDMAELPETLLAGALEERAGALQASLDLARGPLLRIAFFDLGGGRAGRLLLIVHHLVVDGVSWRILIDDLQRGYRQARTGEAIRLPTKTASYKQWVEHLAELTHTAALAVELEYWTELAAPVQGGFARALSANTEGSARVVSTSLEEEATRALLLEVPRTFRTQIDEVLLTALARGLARARWPCPLRIDLEGHGREDIGEGLDVSRTVGWFTAIHPVLLSVDPAATPADSLKSIKEQLRTVPRRGIGYGILRWLSGDERVVQMLSTVPPAEVSFNYLGQAGATFSTEFRMVDGPLGAVHSPRATRRHLLEVTALMWDGSLQVDWTFSVTCHSRPWVVDLANSFLAELRALIACCRNPETGSFTPSDFPEMRFDQRELDDLLADLNETSTSY